MQNACVSPVHNYVSSSGYSDCATTPSIHIICEQLGKSAYKGQYDAPATSATTTTINSMVELQALLSGGVDRRTPNRFMGFRSNRVALFEDIAESVILKSAR
jgi:hypothetical protein